jgi:hypothetical protein
LWGSPHNNAARTVTTVHVVVQCAAFFKLHADHLTLGLLSCFADRFRNFLGFTLAETDAAFLVADHYESGETEALTTFNGFGHTVDGNEAILKFWCFFATVTATLVVSGHEAS